MVKVGDFMQLNSKGTQIYKNCASVDQPYANLAENRWQKHFKCFELKKCMRQIGDQNFIHILTAVRYMTINASTNLCELSNNEKHALSFLQSRDIRVDHKDWRALASPKQELSEVGCRTIYIY